MVDKYIFLFAMLTMKKLTLCFVYSYFANTPFFSNPVNRKKKRIKRCNFMQERRINRYKNI